MTYYWVWNGCASLIYITGEILLRQEVVFKVRACNKDGLEPSTPLTWWLPVSSPASHVNLVTPSPAPTPQPSSPPDW